MAIIYNPEGERLAAREIARWANKVHRQAGGKGNPCSSIDYIHAGLPGHGDRLRGHMCNCGTTIEGYSNGEFKLLPLSDECVVTGGKAYMVCQKCGCYSHL